MSFITPDLFHLLVICHIITGAVGLVSFWVPIAGKKGGNIHVRAGRVFCTCLLATGFFAIMISLTTLAIPLETHPAFDNAEFVRGIFGWMMLYLGILTINLAWYGWQAAINKRNHENNRDWRNYLLQVLLTVAAANVLVRGIMLGEVLMIGISFIGFATVLTNVWFLRKTRPGPLDWQLEHIKALVGAGISVYTAFLAFGAVRLMPQAALSPVLWAIPLTIGLALIIVHQNRVRQRLPGAKMKTAKAGSDDHSLAGPAE